MNSTRISKEKMLEIARSMEAHKMNRMENLFMT